jgi:hypothetical protein
VPLGEDFKKIGYKGYLHVPKVLKTKLDPKSHKCLSLGYCDKMKGYCLWDDTTHKLNINHDVWFDEETSPKSKLHISTIVIHIYDQHMHK